MVPKFESFLLPYLKFLSDKKPHTLKELTTYIADTLKLSDEEREERTKKGNMTKVYDRTQWSGTYLRKALLTQTVGKGKYTITKLDSNFYPLILFLLTVHSFYNILNSLNLVRKKILLDKTIVYHQLKIVIKLQLS